jgi:metallophosphoesterase superfamily enzyme
MRLEKWMRALMINRDIFLHGLKQSNFEMDAKRIFGFEHFLSQIRDRHRKNCLLIQTLDCYNTTYTLFT